MSNQIPPLVCSTPPPIDFSDHDNEDDFGGFETADVIYNGFNDQSLPKKPLTDSKTKQPSETIQLPIPDILDIPSSPISYRESSPPPTPTPLSSETSFYGDDVSPPTEDEVEIPAILNAINEIQLSNLETISSIDVVKSKSNNIDENGIDNIESIQLDNNEVKDDNVDAVTMKHDVIIDDAKTDDTPPAPASFDDDLNDYHYRSESPPSLVLPSEAYSDNEASIYGDDVDNDEISVDIPSSSDQLGQFKAIDISKFDDNTSLPSLNFDSMNESKSTTPVLLLSMPNVLDERVFDQTDTIGCVGDVEDVKTSCDNGPQSYFTDEDVVLQNVVNKLESVEISGNDYDDDIDDDFAEFSSAPPIDSFNFDASFVDDKVVVPIVAVDIEKLDAKFSSHKDDESAGFGCESLEINDEEIGFPSVEPSPFVSNDTGPAFVADFSQFDAFQQFDNPTDKSDLPQSHDLAPLEAAASQRKQSIPISFDNYDDDDFDDNNDFGEFSDFSQAPPIEAKDDSDDDFNDFTDFTTSLPVEATLPTATDETMKSVLQAMFPVTKSTDEDSFVKSDLTNTMTTKLKDYDSSIALNYQWANSSAKHALIKSLGIDSRNILFGSAWNSSMPRFAANLGFTPLEPMKPSVAGPQSSSSSSLVNSTSISKSTSDVPAAQFDWNSSGLVNPLDGVQEILHEAGPSQNQSPRNESNREDSLTASPPKATPTEILDPLPLPIMVEAPLPLTAVTTEPIDDSHTPISTSYVVPGSGTLKETHIFTPSKNYTVPPATIPQDSSIPATVVVPDYDFDQAAAGIIIDEKVVTKEYRDIEYNPEKLRTTSASLNDSDFSEFQSMQLPEHNVLEPIQSDKTVVIAWPEPGGDCAKSFEIEDHFQSYTSASQKTDVKHVNVIDSIEQQIDNMSGNKIKQLVVPMFTKPIIGVSPTDTMFTSEPSVSVATNDFDDEFNDFQSVPIDTSTFGNGGSGFIPPPMMPMDSTVSLTPTVQKITSASNASQLNVLMRPQNTSQPSQLSLNPVQLIPNQLLQPSLLASQLIDPTTIDRVPEIQWPEPGIDPDELARLEAIFPQPKSAKSSSESGNAVTLQDSTKKSPLKSQNEEDEWSDFVSVTPQQSTLTQTSKTKTSPAKLHTQTTTAEPDEDDWTDFVSSTPAPVAPWSISKPNFSSWNTPQLPSTHQFNSWHNTNMFLPTQNHYVPNTSQGMNHNNNLPIINGLNQHHQNVMSNKPGSPIVNRQKAPKIALLPDLGFMAPNSVLKMPKSGFQKK